MNIVFSTLEKNIKVASITSKLRLHTLHQSGELGSILKVLQRMRLIMKQMNAAARFTRPIKNNK